MLELQSPNGGGAEGEYSSYGPSKQTPINHPRPALQHWGRSDSYGPGPSQWAQAIWVKIWSHRPPGILAYGSSLALGDSNIPMDHKTRKRQKGPKRAKKAANHNLIKNGHSNGQVPKWPKAICNRCIKENGDRTPPWIMPKVN
ncbi:hypothetical protein O181_026645 [Austropuccinia psidii MF-1]|uniref:Uncharacterized protein n=1 Tax=Austropuccinia psidii MF-1 TaxID=1389203 RepID=A0A9Q3CPN6_9BASI|nr:hypothetical protein [Austropuccinia psidii MF-1]